MTGTFSVPAFSNVSHEFRTPLTLMLGPLDDAQAAGAALSGDSLDAVQRNAQRLLKLVNTLPLASSSESRLPADPRRALRRSEKPAAAGMVMIVDDNVDAADLLSETLRILGFETCVAHDGPSALALAARVHPRLALLDIGLPVMDGYELGKRLRTDPGLADLRLVAITGYGQESDRSRSRDVGFDDHLVKPIDIERLASLINELAKI